MAGCVDFEKWIEKYYGPEKFFGSLREFKKIKESGGLEKFIEEESFSNLVTLVQVFQNISIDCIEMKINWKFQQAIQFFEQKLQESESEGKEHVHSGIVSEREAH